MLLHHLVVSLTLPFAIAASGGVTVLFQNDGNWTSHADKQSALLVLRESSYDDAVATCTSYGETLLGCTQVRGFYEQLRYQRFLGNIGSDQHFWSDCNQSSLASWNGASTAAENDSGLHYFICTNSAPIVDKVDTDYSVYPRVNASANGSTFEGLRDHMAFRFLGIPFARPPIGGLRFKYAEPWTASFVDATKYSAACLQHGWYDGNSHGLNPWGNSEDCLYLNVFTPAVPDAAANDTAAPRPVLFWMHGGGHVTGTGIDSTFDGASLASRSDVVVVTINYRLNIFGYLSLDDEAIPGNYATSDKVAALQWVKKYISAFGGNPSNVTIFGQSAGGGAVVDLIIAPHAEGLFHGAIVQSGGGWAISQSEAAGLVEPYIEPLCNGTDTTRLECLQALSAETLLNLTTKQGYWRSVVDSNYTPDDPVAQVAKGRQAVNPVKLMLGFLPEEGQSMLETTLAPNVSSLRGALDKLLSAGSVSPEQSDAVLDSGLWLVGNEAFSNGSTTYTSAYNASASIVSDLSIVCGGSQFASVGAASSAFESLWVYSLQRGYGLSYYNWYDLCTFPAGEPDTPYYRCHSGDLYEVFGTYYLFDQPVRVPEDIYFTNAVQDMWAWFARTGDPNVDEEYLQARGYNSTIKLVDSWQWPEFSAWDPRVAAIEHPASSYTTLPEQRHCSVLLPLIA